MGNLGAMELLLIAGIGMLVFGAGRVSELGKGLGQGIRNFKLGLRDSASEAATPPPVAKLEGTNVVQGGDKTTV